MPISNYGVWAGLPTRYTAQTAKQDPKSPHITLYFTDSAQSSTEHTAAINVKSLDKDSRLAYYYNANFQYDSLTSSLQALDNTFHAIDTNSTDVQGLDFTRFNPPLLDLASGRLLPHDIPGPDNDILDEMTAILDRAIAAKATVYIFGSSFGTGIHDVHMNQGSLPRFANGVYQDGAILFQYPDTKKWEAVFLAFASQKVPTDDTTGEPLANSETVAMLITGTNA